MYWNVALRSVGLWVILSLATGHLTEQEKSTIVDMHNEVRSKVQPSAAFMQKVVWSEALRVVAEAYAAKCIWDHNPELEELTIGENLFVGTGPFNVTKAMLGWFEEHVDYNYESNNCSEDKMCGHYTQMVWANSFKIGCATHLCDKLEYLDFEKVTLLVCNYFPPGNAEGQKPYESGDPCSKCPDEQPVCDNNMCVENLFRPSEEPESEDTDAPTVLPGRPLMTTEPDAVPKEPTQVHVIPVEIGREGEFNHGYKMESVSALLVMSVLLLAALVL
ncbi:peptidase inhibitor 16 isoform X2 [Labeo rohita]|uniref:peptidase inhibitor 16 isoform X2 n=1 Tax=Labeo rohita TaxID=84645 RepID=UPI0021E23F0C|nr:peptidase inhibitor 16 isoform X2 [Labeo rohita]